jgi:hypothetical protein
LLEYNSNGVLIDKCGEFDGELDVIGGVGTVSFCSISISSSSIYSCLRSDFMTKKKI